MRLGASNVSRAPQLHLHWRCDGLLPNGGPRMMSLLTSAVMSWLYLA